jgi:hypothetical protein
MPPRVQSIWRYERVVGHMKNQFFGSISKKMFWQCTRLNFETFHALIRVVGQSLEWKNTNMRENIPMEVRVVMLVSISWNLPCFFAFSINSSSIFPYNAIIRGTSPSPQYFPAFLTFSPSSSSSFIVTIAVFFFVVIFLGKGVSLRIYCNPNLLPIAKMSVSTLHNQNFLSSLLKHHHFEHFQELETHSFEQQPCVDLQKQPCQH